MESLQYDQVLISGMNRKASWPAAPGLERSSMLDEASILLPQTQDLEPDAVVPPPAPSALDRWRSAPPNLTTVSSPGVRTFTQGLDQPMYVVGIDELSDEEPSEKKDLRLEDRIPGDDGGLDLSRDEPFGGFSMLEGAPGLGLPGLHGYNGWAVPPPVSPSPLAGDYYMGAYASPVTRGALEDPSLMWQGIAPSPEMAWGMSPCNGTDLPWGCHYGGVAPAPGLAVKKPMVSDFKLQDERTASGRDPGDKAQAVQKARVPEEDLPAQRAALAAAEEDTGSKASALARIPSVRPNTLEAEGSCISWWPDCKKLEVRGQKHIVSPALHFDAEGKAMKVAEDGSIESPPADGESKCVKFIIMIQAKKVAPGRGGESFVKAKGRARFEVKCEEPCTATFLLSVGSARPEGSTEEGGVSSEEQKLSDTPVTHDFGETPVFVYPDEWDLQPLKASLVVSLELQALKR
mmetsp:Transcript_35373/g.82711  ORF Transcript_35373/g.82711 Transcript_35373/m.82711 type:complete len:461 (+) Transcript_35373:166-1548(+)|eukprot:CAMPEP_0178445958 /NCGR_PEP_ID=MMETSP0689_2-20121128/40498_1 /TAXON_ID=160604 /ORGANISM="Amphidinium massartii, Strain CS-259" /LENGTH=460 /DNA_ID=CAMNT_0020070651 /DNA_START=149 /DNA_END=1531 /DNA_ORIENTATION=+